MSVEHIAVTKAARGKGPRTKRAARTKRLRAEAQERLEREQQRGRL